MLGILIIVIFYLFMKKDAIVPASNSEVLNSIDQLNKGNRKSSNQLIFDPTTGEFVIAKPNENLPPDATTINSIAQDGFANKAK